MPRKVASRIKVFAVCSILQALLQIAKSQENVNLLEKGVGRSIARAKTWRPESSFTAQGKLADVGRQARDRKPGHETLNPVLDLPQTGLVTLVS